jgi:Ala-tRNA(Pro) deacylase
MANTNRDPAGQALPVFDRLVALLSAGNARFRVLDHPAEGQSDAVARIRGTSPGQGAKAMLCVTKGAAPVPVLAVLPGPAKLDFRKLGMAVGAKKATLADPAFAQEATGCVMGAVPPFALSPGIRLVVDPALLSANLEIAFNAGRLDRSIVLAVDDYLRLARPQVADILVAPGLSQPRAF